MKVLLINGSTRKNGCGKHVLEEAARIFEEEGVETVLLEVGSKSLNDCLGCNKCQEIGKCVFDDMANAIVEKMRQCQGILIDSPVYFSHPTGSLLSVLDRAFLSGGKVFEHKVAGAITTLRRGGASITLDVLNKFFFNASMILVGSTYWNMVHGNSPEENDEDREGMQTIRNLARNMAFVMKCLAAGEESGIKKTELERTEWTNFIR